jgi:hypothetical protein
MQTIPVIFSRSILPLSYVIRLLDKGAFICPFSHVGIISECGSYVYEARGGDGVIKTPLWLFKDRASYWETGLFPTLNKQKAYERAESQLGKPYDLMGAIAIGVPFINRDWGCPDSWFCSEFLAYCSGIFEERHISNIGVNFCYALTRTKRL